MRTIVWFGLVLGALSAAGKVIITKVGEKVTLDCEASSLKMLVWNHRGNLIISVDGKSGFQRKGSGDIVRRSKVKSTKLEISSVADGDAGTFTCVAGSTTHEHTLVLVSVSVNPSSVLQLESKATLDCKVEPSELDVIVQWKRPDGGSPTGSRAVELQSVGSSDAGNWQCTVSYQGETFNETLTIRIKEHAPKTTTPSPSHNSKDSRKPTCVDCVIDHPSRDAVLLLLGLSWWMWLAIGLGSLVVILLVVFVIIMCKRVRRRKRKFQRMKNTPLPLKPKKYCQCDRTAAAAKPQQRRRREKPSALPL